MWKLWWFACLQYGLISLPDGTNIYGLRTKEFGALGRCRGLKVVKSCSKGTLSVHLFRHFCRSMYRLATMNSVTDRRTNRTDNIIMPIADPTPCSTIG